MEGKAYHAAVLQPAGLWPSGCVRLLLRMRKPGKVVTQSPPGLKLVPLKFGMSSEAEEMSSKPSPAEQMPDPEEEA